MILIKNAEIFDGVSENSFTGSVAIDKKHIVRVVRDDNNANSICACDGDEVIDAKGKVLCPGFIDTHSHNDYFAGKKDCEKYFTPLIRQGITTIVAGNCGFSASGHDPYTPFAGDLAGLFPYNPDYRAWADFSDFFALCDSFSPVNVVCHAGHGTLRRSVRGAGPGELSHDQRAKMDSLMHSALEEGASGISLGLMYDPDMFAGKDEIYRAAIIAKEHGKPLTFHIRANSAISTSYDSLFGRAHNLRATDEVIEIAEKTGVKCHISHLIFVGKSSWKTLDENISLIDNANAAGCDISFDLYSSDFGASCINVILPSWYQGMSPDEKRKLSTRIKLFTMINGAKKLLGMSFHDLEITFAGSDHPEYVGKRVDEIARALGISPLAAYLRIIDETDADAAIHMYKYANEHIINVLSRHSRASFMTDAWVRDEGAQNAAVYGSFPKFLRLSREGKAAPLGEFIRKATGGAAANFGIAERGVITEGNYADIVVFDKATVRENGCAYPEGISHVLINGAFAVKDGVRTGSNSGLGIRVSDNQHT